MAPPEFDGVDAGLPAPRLPQCGRNTTVGPALKNAFLQYIEEGWISDWMHVIRSGKEAEVHCCRAHPHHGGGCFALKAFKSSEYRSFKNNARYMEGRTRDPGTGRQDRRLGRALRRKGRIGRRLEADIWTQAEYDHLSRLYSAGARVPKPLASVGSTILMEFIGDGDGTPAPALNDARLEPPHAARVFEQVVEEVRLFLRHEIVHGDLSAFNILLHEGQPVVIDFPQAIDCRQNTNGYEFLARDLQSLGLYFGHGRDSSFVKSLADGLWREYLLGED